jgi:glutathione S-transferase
MLTLYHNEMSTASQKVRFVLSEKKIEWTSRVMNLAAGEQHRPDYLTINANGVVPALLHDDRIIIESTVINEYLDETFTEHPLLPASPLLRARVRTWTVQVDESIHALGGVLSLGIATRFPLLGKSFQDIAGELAGIPDVVKRERLRDVILRGMETPMFAIAVLRFRRMLTDMEKALGDSPWLADDRLTLADIALAPYVTRLEHLRLELMWNDLPRVATWYGRLRDLPAYRESHSKWFNEKALALMAEKGMAARKGVQRILDA